MPAPSIPPSGPGRPFRNYAYTDGLVTVTNVAALAPFKAKLRKPRNADIHVVLEGDSIGVGYYAYNGVKNGWFGRFVERLKAVAGDGGTFIPCSRGEKEAGAHQVQLSEDMYGGGSAAAFVAPASGGPGYPKNTNPISIYGNGEYFLPWTNLGAVASGWTKRQLSSADGGAAFGGYAFITGGSGTADLKVLYPPHRYFEPIYTKVGTGQTQPPAANGGAILKATFPDATTATVNTLDASLNGTGKVGPNNIWSNDLTYEQSRRVILNQNSANGYAATIEGVRVRKSLRGVIDYNLGFSGRKITDLVTIWTNAADIQHHVGLGCVTPDLFVFCMGYNDYATRTQLQVNADTTTYINAIIAAANFNCPLLVVIYPPGGNANDSDFAARTTYYQGIAATIQGLYANTVVADLSALWTNVSGALAKDLYTNQDTTHPSENGHTFWADHLYRALGLPYLG